MKKKLVIEMIVYGALVILGLILLVAYRPEEPTVVIPSDYKIQWDRREE